MKKLILLLIAVFSIFYLNSCSDSPIDVGNKSENKKLYAEYEEKSQSFQQAYLTAKTVEMQVNVEVYNEKESVSLKSSLSPLSYEIDTPANYTVYQANDDYIYEYVVDKTTNNVKKNKHMTVEEFKNRATTFAYFNNNLNEEEYFSLKIDPTKSKVSCRNNSYYFKTVVKDFLPQKEIDQINEFIDMTKTASPVDIYCDFENEIVEIFSSITDKQYYLSYSFSITLKNEIQDIVIPMKASMTLKINSFTPVKFEDMGYYIEKPQSFSDVSEYSDVNQEIEVLANEKYYGKVKLEKGTYLISNSIGSDNDHIGITLYDSNKNIINPCVDFNKGLYHEIRYYYDILQDGDYYFYVTNYNKSANKIKFNKVEIDKSIFNNFSRLEDTSFTFSKDNDFKLFDLELSTEDAIQIKNDSKKAIKLTYFDIDKKYYQTVNLNPNTIFVFKSSAGLQKYIIWTEEGSDDVIKIDVDLISNAANDYNMMQSLNQEEQYVYLNPLDEMYLKFSLSSGGIIDSNAIANNATVKIYSSNGEECSKLNGHYILSSGDYYLHITNNTYAIISTKLNTKLTKLTELNELKFGVTTTFSTQKIYTLNFQNPGLFKVTLDESVGSLALFNTFTNEVSYTYQDSYNKVTEGTYLLGMEYYNKNEQTCNITANYYDTSNKEVNAYLYTTSTLPNYLSKSRIYNYKNVENQIVKYWFTLANDTNILYSTSDVDIYDENGNRVCFSSDVGASFTYTIAKLKAGKYYFISKILYSLKEELEIYKTTISSNEACNDNNLIINSNEEATFDSAGYYIKYFIVDIKEEGSYTVNCNGLIIEILDNEYNKISVEEREYNTDSVRYVYNLSVGQHLVAYKYANYTTTTGTVIFTKNN